MSAGTPVRLSIVVALQPGESLTGGALAALASQCRAAPERVEILLVDGRPLGSGVAETPVDAAVRVVRAPELPSLPLLLARGIEESTGELVATTEAHVSFDSDWVEHCLQTFRDGSAEVVGGIVEPGSELGPLAIALYLCDYAQFAPPLAAGPSTDLPGCNVVFARRVLDTASGVAVPGHWKTFLCRALARRGARLVRDPYLVVGYHRELSITRWCRRRWVHGRCFGGMRAPQLGPARRLAVAIAAPVLPLVLLFRLARRAWPKPALRWPLIATLPLCLFAHALWMMGEWTGNLFGVGGSCREV